MRVSVNPDGDCSELTDVGCVSMEIKQAAVKEGLVIDAVSVDIEMGFADGAPLGFGEDSAAPLETRFFIRIDLIFEYQSNQASDCCGSILLKNSKISNRSKLFAF